MRALNIIILFLLLCSINSFSTDTLKIREIINKNDSIISSYRNADSMLFYASKSLKLLNNNKSKYSKKEYWKLKVGILDDYGLAYIYKGDFRKAQNYFTEELSLNRQIGDYSGIATNYSDIGYTYDELSEPNLALEYYFKALSIDKELGNKAKIVIRYNNIGNVYKAIGRKDDAILYFKKCIKLNSELKDTTELASSYLNLAAVYKDLGKFSNAMEHYTKSLNILTKSNDYRSIATNLSNIGALYQEWEKYNLAIEYYNEALEYDKKSGNVIGYAIRYNNLATTYTQMFESDSAIAYYNKSLEIFKKYQLKKYAATTESNIGNLMLGSKKYNEALNIFNNSLKTFKELNDFNNIASTYFKIGKTYNLMKNYKNAELYINKSISVANKIGDLSQIVSNYDLLSEIYEKQGKHKIAYTTLKQHIEIKDSLFSEENMKQMNEYEIKYNTVKKENKIKLLQKESKISALESKKQKAELKTQKIIIYSAVFVLLIIIVFSVLLYRQFLAKKKKNIQLNINNIKITKQNHEISIQRDLVINQRDLIGEQKQAITDSIIYAKNIQQAVLPAKEVVDSLFKNYFILYKPKDIVSGDFYWVKSFEYKNKNYKVIVVADCTGHGVPGAFMSMLGASSLSDIFIQSDEINPASVLNKLRNKIVRSLQQKGKEKEAKDGMDMSVVIINKTDNILRFAGANQNLLISSLKTDAKFENILAENNDRHIIEYKGDRMPVGIHRKIETEFTQIEYSYKNKDRIYLMSDGYVDQFGGKKAKKFKKKQFIEMLINIQNNNMDEQQKIVSNKIEDWMNSDNYSNSQIDDILIFGIELG